jgi:hypothetical protein
MFGDGSWTPGRTEAQEATLKSWLRGLKQAGVNVAVVEIGAGTAIPTVRHRSESVASDLGMVLIRINVREAKVPRGGLGLHLTAAEGIQRILARPKGEQ